jgi:hypothetical protein
MNALETINFKIIQYQAGYCSSNRWVICAFGKTENEAVQKLDEAVKAAALKQITTYDNSMSTPEELLRDFNNICESYKRYHFKINEIMETI